MGSGVFEYFQLMEQLKSYSNVPNDLINSLRSYSFLVYTSDLQDRFSEPMPWIGIYIALASLFCILAMVADILHGLRNKKLWFPCKYFTLNAASLSVIAVAMKLPMDLNNSMPGAVDQAAKLGSMAFMCTMMSHLLPALATLDNKELVTNIIALGVLVITLVVNVCIQIKTGVVSSTDVVHMLGGDYYPRSVSYYNKPIAIIYVAMLLMLLIIHGSSSLAILKSKQILELKYQAAHEKASRDQELQQPGGLVLEKLKQHVRNYWIMEGTGNPQFMTACFATTSASGVLCVLSTVLHVIIMLFKIGSLWDFESDYKWSMLIILMIQFIGSVLGTIAPLSRCFAALSFKLSIKWIWNNMKVFKVEKYWTQMLSDLKDSSIPFGSSSHKFKIVVQNLKVIILNFSIGFQKAVVVTCKIIGLIPIFIVICIFNCLCCWKWLMSIFSTFGIVLIKDPAEQHETNEILSHYVLQLQDDTELAERTLRRITNSVDQLIKKAEKQQPYNLMKLLEGSRGFRRVEKFDSHQVLPLLLEEPPNCWSLTLVNLTTIAICLHNIQNNKADYLLSGVSEGLVYVTLVEESLTATHDHVSIQRAAQTLWLEVEVYHKWLGNKLQKLATQVHTAGQILQWFRGTAKNLITEVESTDTRGQDDNSKCRSISANSMYHITESILLSYGDIDKVSQEELIAHLSSLITDILAACLTNLPQVIAMKCYSSAIEKREASVHVAAQLLGETTKILSTLQDCELPSLNPDEFAFIVDKWRSYLKHPFSEKTYLGLTV